MIILISVSHLADINRTDYHDPEQENLQEDYNYIYCKLINGYFNFTTQNTKALKVAKSELVLQKFTVCSVHPLP